MAYELEKSTGDIVISGFEQGIQPSPHKGTANIQNANISTEMGEVVSSFSRVQDTLTNTTATGTLGFVDSSHVSLNIANTNNLFKGNWITVTGSSNTGQLPNGTYYVPPSTGANFQLSNYYNNGFSFVPATLSLLVVGGGGAGGAASDSSTQGGGGGGAGQVVATTATISSLTPIAVTVGAGGIGSSSVLPTNGSSSSFGSTTAIGGGYGGGQGSSVSLYNPNSGASGGGGEGSVNNTLNAGGTGTAGNNGGANFQTSSLGVGAAGGGGGSNAVGATATSGAGAAGGAGISNSITGASVNYAGGGGGSGVSSSGAGGAGGGGAGAATNNSAGIAGTANTGGGGGGGRSQTSGSTFFAGGNGGSGVVILSAPIGQVLNPVTAGGIHTTAGGNDIWTFNSSSTWTPLLATIANPSFISGFTTGLTASFTMVATMGKSIASATETYRNNGTVYNRYYILDSNNLVWVYDTQDETLYSPSDNVNWFLPDFHTDWCTDASGIAVISGFLVGLAESGVYGKSVALLGNSGSTSTTWTQFNDITGWNGATASTSIPHFGLVGHQGALYITDANYIANIFPDATLADPASTADNVQSFCLVSGETATEAVYSIISGTSPVTSDGLRTPVVFFAPNGSTLPTSITAGTVFYIQANDSAFQTYAASTGGIALDMTTGQSGTLYFNTFYPIAAASAYDGTTPTFAFTNQDLFLPKYEIAQCMAEIGNQVVIGCISSTMYVWNQFNASYSNLISLPEANVETIITVHQMAYIFCGNKGNIYITDGSVASAVTTIPDYCAGVPGTPLSYIEPVFNWGGAMYLRGRVYFSILDQTTTKAGNCGGIWSFVPTQNLYIGQDVGIGMRLENQSSYGNYNGYAPVLIAKVNQNAIAPQYFSGWESSISSPTYGIDATGTTFSSVAVIESDAIPTGTMLDKKTFSQIEFKLASPLSTGDTVTLFYRKNLTDAWKTLGAVQLQSDRLSGYVAANFEKSQWLQLRTLLNSSSSFIRLVEKRIR